MDFADEPYVRLYTRKTLTWKLLGWEGRTVRNAMLDGEFDAAGIFAIQGDPAECISAVTDLPLEIVRVGLERLIRTKTWVVTSAVIAWPHYEEAQNCRRSDRVRQRESRRARSAQSVTDVTLARPANVTDVTAPRELSPPVTACHPPSHPPSAPILPPTRERETRRLPEVPGLQIIAATSRAITMPGPEPTESYLGSCVAAGVSDEQARSTWSHYFGEGLPPRGVERLEHWLVQRAKERKNQLSKLARAGPKRSGSLQPNAGLTGFETAKETA